MSPNPLQSRAACFGCGPNHAKYHNHESRVRSGATWSRLEIHRGGAARTLKAQTGKCCGCPKNSKTLRGICLFQIRRIRQCRRSPGRQGIQETCAPNVKLLWLLLLRTGKPLTQTAKNAKPRVRVKLQTQNSMLKSAKYWAN